ncbi:hypothetical protein PMIN06_013174 [Paraphaeosphaeria minitans]
MNQLHAVHTRVDVRARCKAQFPHTSSKQEQIVGGKANPPRLSNAAARSALTVKLWDSLSSSRPVNRGRKHSFNCWSCDCCSLENNTKQSEPGQQPRLPGYHAFTTKYGTRKSSVLLK